MSTHASHHMLANLAEHQRDKEALALQELTNYREKLRKIIQQSSIQIKILQQQRDKKIERGAQAFELMLLEESLSEHQLHISDVSCEMMALDIAIKQQKKKWSNQHKKLKVHEKLHQQHQRKMEAVLRQKTQVSQDEQYTTRLMQKQKVSP